MAAFVIGALVAGLAAAGAATITGVAVGAAFFNAFATTLILGGLAKALAKKPRQAEFTAEGRTITVRQAIPPRQVVIGETRVGGALTFLHFAHSGNALTSEHTIIPAGLTYTVKLASAFISSEYVIQRNWIEGDDSSAGRHNHFLFTKVASAPGPDEYSVTAGVYTFNAANVGDSIEVGYRAGSIQTDITHMVITLAGHRCAGFGRIWFDDELVTLDASGNATGKYSGHVRIKLSLGDEGTAQPFPDLVAESGAKWGSDYLQAGCTKMYVRLNANPELFPNGVPNVTAELRGALLFDPRTDTTLWSNNATLALSNYFTSTDYGLGADYSIEIHDADCVSAANSCDEAVSLASASSPFTADASTDVITLASGARQLLTGVGVRVASSGTLPAGLSAGTTYFAIRAAEGYKLATSLANARAATAINITSAGSGTHTLTWWNEPRYTANGSFLTSEKPVDVIQRMLAAMGGTAVNVGDQWHINAGVYNAPTVTLDEDDLAGPSVIQAHVPSREDGNGVKGVCVNPDANWQPDDFPAITSGTYLAEDGGERRWRDLDLSAFVTSLTQAQRLGKIDLLRARQALTEAAPFKIPAWATIPGRTVARTDAQLGWSAKPFEIQSSELAIVEDADHNTTIQVKQLLRETAAAVYDWSTSEEQAKDLAPNTSLPDVGEVAPPGNPAITEELYETSGSAGLKSKAIVTWAASSYTFDLSYQLEYQLTSAAAADWIVLPPLRETGQEIVDLAPGRYNFRVRALGFGGSRSLYGVTLDREIVGLTAPPSDVTNFSVRVVSGQTMAVLTQSPDLDVRIGGRLIIRWSALSTGATWNDGSLLAPEGWPGDSESVFVPLLPGTYLAKFRDSSGNYSVNAASFVTTEALLTGFSTLGTATEHPAYTGAKVNVAEVDDAIQLDGTTLWDDLGLVDSLGEIDSLGGIASSGSYTFANRIDLGSALTVRLFPNFQSLGFDSADSWDSRTDPIDDWDSIDGGVIEDAEVVLEVRTTNDNPAGSPTWGPWHPLPGQADYTARAFEFRMQFTSANVTHNRRVSELAVVAKQPT